MESATQDEELPLPRELAIRHIRPGQPSKLTDKLTASIAEDVANGVFYNVACRRAGIGYATMREWVARGDADLAVGRKLSKYAKFRETLAHAEAEHEAKLTAALSRGGDGKFSDWRAQAFVLERRHRERWGPPQQDRAPAIVIQLPAELATALADVARALEHRRALTIDASSTPLPSVATDEDSAAVKR